MTLIARPTVMRAKRSFMIATPRWPDDASGIEWRQWLTDSHTRTDIVAAVVAPPSLHRRQRKELWLGGCWHGARARRNIQTENRMSSPLDLLG